MTVSLVKPQSSWYFASYGRRQLFPSADVSTVATIETAGILAQLHGK